MEKLFPLFAFDIALAGAVFALFKFLGKSQPLNEYAAELLTRPGLGFQLQRQFLLVKQRLLGERFFSGRRFLIVMFIYALAFIWLVYVHFSRRESENTFWDQYATFYFFGWEHLPGLAIKIFIMSIVLSLISIEISERTFRSSWLRSNRTLSRWLLAFGASATVTLLFGLIATTFIWSRSGDPDCAQNVAVQWSNYVWRLTLWNLLPSWYEGIFQHPGPCVETESFETIEFLVLTGTLLLSFSVMFLSPVVNLLYCVGVVIGRLHRWALYRFGFEPDEVLDKPVEYIGRILSLLVFIVSATITVMKAYM